jgi:hypothetical protein
MYTQTDLQMHLQFITKQYMIKFELEYKQHNYLFIYTQTQHSEEHNAVRPKL